MFIRKQFGCDSTKIEILEIALTDVLQLSVCTLIETQWSVSKKLSSENVKKLIILVVQDTDLKNYNINERF